ncbi:MAG: hypothetical protein ACRDNW_12795 [Trebonia sp.]
MSAVTESAFRSNPESCRLSSRARQGKRLKAMSGEPNTTTRPLGFEDDFVTVREAEAEIIWELTKRFLAGEPQHALVRDLNARGILSSTEDDFGRVCAMYAARRRSEPTCRQPCEVTLTAHRSWPARRQLQGSRWLMRH